MIGACQVVTHRLGGPGAQKDGAGMLNPIGQCFRTLDQQFQVLRREAVAQLSALLQLVAHHHQAPVLEGCFADLAAGMPFQLFGDGGAHGIGQFG